MPTKTKTSKSAPHPKRHGLHHRHSKHYKQVYWPFIPLLSFVLILGLAVSLLHNSHPRRVLSYATEMSHTNLLSATNSKRSENSKASLNLSEKLNQAAQAKANDMAARDYWSHNTPDGQEPWIFFDQVGYSYKKAGENLAYGFSTSSSTVTGWMNSPSHKDNMLDSAFTEVGFGYVNSANYQSSGEETIVVAMYGQPQQLGASSSPAPTPAPAATAKAPATVASVPSQQAAPAEETPAAEEPQPVTSLTSVVEQPTQQVARVQDLTNGRAPWALFAAGITSGSAVTGLLVTHGIRLRKLLRQGEKFFIKHPLFDLSLIGVAVLGVELTRTVGFIR